MRYITFAGADQASYDVCFLVPQLNGGDMRRLYIEPHLAGSEPAILAYDLHKEGKKTPVKVMREYLDELLPVLGDLQIRYLVTCDGDYFKTLTREKSAENALGYVKPCAHPGFEHMQVVYCPNFRTVFYDPDKVKANIRIALEALEAHRAGGYIDPGLQVIKFAEYPRTVREIGIWLDRLLEWDCDLSSDIEGFSLKHYEAGLGSITFCWSKHEGIAFPIDLMEKVGDQIRVRALLKSFFQKYARTGRRMVWHNISYDVTVLIYQLFMKDLTDTGGLLDGLDVMLAAWEDTKLITYLATNSCQGNTLGLKAQALEFAGNYAVEEIKDIRKIPLPELLQYNLVDGLCTWFVAEKHWATMVADQQLALYTEMFKPAIWDIIQMQLTGLPVDKQRTEAVAEALQAISDDAVSRMNQSPSIAGFVEHQTYLAWEKDFADRKSKAKKPEKIQPKDLTTFPVKPFNPNSSKQLQMLLYDGEFFELPIIERTDTGAEATGGETIEKLVNHTQSQGIKDFLLALVDYKAVDKILSAFLPAFLAAPEGPDGWHYLFGSFNLGGTVSGRLSSSGPNLQNLPANVFMKVVLSRLPAAVQETIAEFVNAKGELHLGKLIKSCFRAPPGWIFVGLDFDSLEDRISALTTKDPEKLKVYTDGYDGHCLRAYSYFGDRMPDIDPTSVESINSIAKLYKRERQDSKPPTFALTYRGTWHTLMANCGFTRELAQTIETKYHELYRVSDEWVASKIAEAGRVGYLTVAFGLRLRTPLLRQVVLGTSKTPHEAEREGRTAGNALGQSWGLLNTRAWIEFMRKVRSSKYRLDIRPCAQIHDSGYALIRDDMDVLTYTNKHLPEAVRWQDHPDIAHDEVKLSGRLSIFYPTWAQDLELPNDCSTSQIKELAKKHFDKYCA